MQKSSHKTPLTPQLVANQRLIPLMESERVHEAAEHFLDSPDETLCYCNEIHAKEVIRSIQSLRTRDIDEIAVCCGAGTDCGSCRQDIAALVEHLLHETPLASETKEHKS